MDHKIIETLDFERETKGSILYKNKNVHGGTAIYNIYVRKSAFTSSPYPDQIEVTIEDVSGD